VATETIREFLVSLGFVSDEPALKKFEQGISNATKAVFALATAIETTAVAVAAGVARLASNLETLYFAAQRTGSSATQLKALDVAARSLGAQAGEAQAAVEGLATALRTNPGNVGVLTGLLGRFGMTAQKNANGTINAADALIKLSQAFKSMGPQAYFQAAQFAQQLGISEQTLYQLTSGDLVGKYRTELERLGTDGFDKAAENSHNFMDQLRDFGAQLELFGARVESVLTSKLIGNLQKASDWLVTNGPALAKTVSDAAAQIIQAAQWIGDKVAWLVGKLKEWNEETGGLSTKLLALAVLLKVSGAGSIIGGVLSLAGAFVRLAAAMAGVNAAGSAGVLARLLGPVGAGVAAGWALDKYFPNNWLAQAGRKLGGDWYDALHPYGDSLGLRLNNPGNLEFRNQAYAIPGGPGGRWANFASPGEGLFALGRQLEMYGMRGINSVQSIVSKWAPPGENNTAGYIRDVMKRTGYSADQALNLQDPAVLSNLMNAVIWHEQGKNPYQAGLVSGKAGEAIDYVRGTTVVSPQTTIHVNGAGDPSAVAKRVADQQRQVNADLTRNFVTPVQ